MTEGPKFPSPRAALAHMFACRQGPGLRSPSLAPPVQGNRPTYDEHAAHLVAAIVRGELGIVEGSDEWHALREWVVEKVPRSSQVEAMYRRVFRSLRKHGLLATRAEPPKKPVWEWTDEEGRRWLSFLSDSKPLGITTDPADDDRQKTDLTDVPDTLQD